MPERTAQRSSIGAVRWSNGFDCVIEFLVMAKEERIRLLKCVGLGVGVLN
jgi:hypothetical protein